MGLRGIHSQNRQPAYGELGGTFHEEPKGIYLASVVSSLLGYPILLSSCFEGETLSAGYLCAPFMILNSLLVNGENN